MRVKNIRFLFMANVFLFIIAALLGSGSISRFYTDIIVFSWIPLILCVCCILYIFIRMFVINKKISYVYYIFFAIPIITMFIFTLLFSFSESNYLAIFYFIVGLIAAILLPIADYLYNNCNDLDSVENGNSVVRSLTDDDLAKQRLKKILLIFCICLLIFAFIFVLINFGEVVFSFIWQKTFYGLYIFVNVITSLFIWALIGLVIARLSIFKNLKVNKNSYLLFLIPIVISLAFMFMERNLFVQIPLLITSILIPIVDMFCNNPSKEVLAKSKDQRILELEEKVKLLENNETKKDTSDSTIRKSEK